MKKGTEQYIKSGYVVFSIEISQKEENGIWKKSISFPKKGWRNLNTSLIEKTYKKEDFVVIKEEYKNGLAMETGKKNNIIVIDIDNIEHWGNFLKDNKQEDIKRYTNS